jgi:hypothetical protein
MYPSSHEVEVELILDLKRPLLVSRDSLRRTQIYTAATSDSAKAFCVLWGAEMLAAVHADNFPPVFFYSICLNIKTTRGLVCLCWELNPLFLVTHIAGGREAVLALTGSNRGQSNLTLGFNH